MAVSAAGHTCDRFGLCSLSTKGVFLRATKVVLSFYEKYSRMTVHRLGVTHLSVVEKLRQPVSYAMIVGSDVYDSISPDTGEFHPAVDLLPSA